MMQADPHLTLFAPYFRSTAIAYDSGANRPGYFRERFGTGDFHG